MKQPKRLTLQSMFSTLDEDRRNHDKLYYNNGLAIALNINRLFKPFINKDESPFMLEDYRLGVVKSGYIHGIINLQEYTINAGTVVFITPGTIVEPLEMSDDFIVMGIGIPDDRFHIIHSGHMPDIFNGQTRHGIIPIDDAQRQILDQMFGLLWNIAGSASSSDTVVNCMLTTISSFVGELFAKQSVTHIATHTNNDIFNRFIALVNAHCREQRQLAFYADKICITERYLGTVVRQTSGVTAKEWIDRAVITAAKVMLRHSDEQVAQIAERLNFPNPSFFCKYFKRIVGKTPQGYRTPSPSPPKAALTPPLREGSDVHF